MENFYYFDKSTTSYIIRPEYFNHTIKMVFTVINKENSEFWKFKETMILHPDNNGVFLSLYRTPFLTHHPVIAFYFELYENSMYSHEIKMYSHNFETFDVFSYENGFIYYYQQEPYLLFNRDFSKNILCWFGNDGVETKKISLGLSNELTLDNHIHTTNLQVYDLSCNLYKYIYFENYQNRYFNWKFKMNILTKESSTSDEFYKPSGEISKKNNNFFMYMSVPVKNICNAVIFQRTDDLKLNVYRLQHKPYYRNPCQLFISSKEQLILPDKNICCVYTDQCNKISSFNLKKFSDYQFILISSSEENITIDNFKSIQEPEKIFKLNKQVQISIFIIQDFNSFKYNNNVYTIRGFVNNPLNNVCLL